MKADLILKSDAVFDSISDTPFKGYVAIKGNRIIKVGRDDAIADLQDNDTIIRDFGNRTIMPGFHDSHTHLLMAGMFKSYPNLMSAKSEEECVSIIREAITNDSNQDKWLLGFSWYHVFWENKQLPTCKSLDKYFPNRPVCLINAEAHGAWINTAAIRKIGLTKDTQAPKGGIIERFDDGSPTGVLLESAVALVTKYAFDLSPAEEENIIYTFMDSAREYGITSINDVQPYFHGNMGNIGIYHDMDKNGKFIVRVHVAPDLLGDLEQVLQWREEYTSDKLHIDHVKQFMDGVCATHTALMLDEYSDDPGNFGQTGFDIEAIEKAVPEAHRRGLSVKLHSCGDRSARYAINYIENAIKLYGKNKCRHAIEHLEVIHDDDFHRIGELGIIPSVQPEHLALTDTFEENPYPVVLGLERGNKTFAYKKMYDEAGILAIGSDCPVVDNNPFLEIYRGVTRLHNDGKPEGGWNPSQKLKLHEVLRSYTYGSAYSVNRENEIGSLKAGNFADIIIIDKNLFEIKESELIDRKVIMTIMDGNIIYERA